MASRIPPLLDPYIRLPPETSLVLLSGVLGSTTNWLVIRYLYSLLSATPDPLTNKDDLGSPRVGDTSVVLISFLRDYAFWRDGAEKLGVDLDFLSRKGKFVFIDGLVGLFSGPQNHIPNQSSENPVGRKVLSTATLQRICKELQDAIAQTRHSASERKAVLIMDQLDLLLAASGDDITSQGIREILLDTREKVHSSIVTLSADEPLISSQITSLEKEHAALVLSLAHDAHIVVSLRMLDTGTARDVSGVLRATLGGAHNSVGGEVEEQELLYFVAGDGGVRVFERGQ